VLKQVFNLATDAHVFAYRATGGIIGHRAIAIIPPTLLLDHVGAKTGRARTTPLSYIRDGEAYVIVASMGGAPRNPAWFHNLKANPRTTIQVGSKTMDVTARVAGPAERSRLWPRVVDTYQGYAGYQARTQREIPLVILEPVQ
jgi:deazaflavin-dependent oxidoreductase (nitroreductase family)